MTTKRLLSALLVLGMLSAVAQADPAEEKAVVVEVRVLRVAEDVFARLGGKLGMSEDGGKVAFLTDREVFLLLEALQADCRTNVLQAPRLTVLDGAEARISIASGQSDGKRIEKADTWSLSVRPSVSAGGKSIRTCLRGDLSVLAGGKVKVKKTLRIADGGTAVLGGWKAETTAACPLQPSMMSTLPYVCRLFKNVGPAPEPGRLLLLVTPRTVTEPSTPEPPRNGRVIFSQRGPT